MFLTILLIVPSMNVQLIVPLSVQKRNLRFKHTGKKTVGHNLKKQIIFSLLAISFVFACRVEGDYFLHRDEQFRKLSLVEK